MTPSSNFWWMEVIFLSPFTKHLTIFMASHNSRVCRGRDHMVVWFYNYICNQCLSPLMLWVRIPLSRNVLDTTLCDKVCQWLATGQWLSPGTPISSTNKTDHHDINTITLTHNSNCCHCPIGIRPALTSINNFYSFIVLLREEFLFHSPTFSKLEVFKWCLKANLWLRILKKNIIVSISFKSWNFHYIRYN
jgi:hypothetical protein